MQPEDRGSNQKDDEMLIRLSSKGDYLKTERFLKNAIRFNIRDIVEKYARAGVEALRNATPFDDGTTANAWTYDIEISHGKTKITWSNTNVNRGVNIAVILQYGHGTGTGGYVEGRDYINPALRPVFDDLANNAWREVTKL